MLLRMLAAPVAGGVIDRRRRRGPGEGPVVADIAPDPPRRTLALGQDTQGGVVAVQPLGRHDVALDQVEERHEGEGPMADLVGQRRQRQVDPLAFEAGALPVERGVHAELVEQDRRQQLRADQAARRCVEGRGRLADLLAVPTGELLAHRLDQFEPARDLLQRPGHVFADLGQAQAAAAGASRRRLDDHALALDVLRPRFADRPFAYKGANLARLGGRGLRGEFILGRGGDEVFEFQFQLLDQSRRALGALAVEFAFELLDPQLEMRDQRLVVRKLRPRIGRFGSRIGRRGPPVGRLQLRQVALGFDPQPRFAFGLQRRKGGGKIRRKSARAQSHPGIRSDLLTYSSKKSIQPALDAMFLVDFSNLSRTEDRIVAPGRLSQPRPSPRAI
jgi:hypothetical protein